MAMASQGCHFRGSLEAAVALLLAILVLGSGAAAARVAGTLSGQERYQCQASSEAKASLHAPPPGIVVGLEHYGYYVFSNNTELSPSLPGGDQTVKRGIFFLPELDVAPEAYAPYAIASAGTGRYSVILNRAEAKLVTKVIFERLDILEWAVVAHGERAGALASKLVASLPGQFTALGLLASPVPDDVDLAKSNAGLYLYYGSQDTVVPPSSLAKFASRLPGDAYVAPLLNAAHFGFAFSDCLGNTATPTKRGSKDTAPAPGAAALRAFEESLTAKFELWPSPTARALSFGDQTLLLPNNVGSKPYPHGIPRNQVTIQRYPVPAVAPAPPRSWYVFAPENIKDGVGLVYFPGAGAPIQGYFPIAFEIAARGHLVVLLEQPTRFTSLDDDVPQLVSDVNAVIDSTIFKGLGVEKWAVGGHSRGGGAATEFVSLQNETYTRKVQALVLHAGRVAVNLTSSPVPAVLIYGSIDRFFLGQPLSPFLNKATTQVHVVEGANHEQTAEFEGPIVGTISSQEQQATFAQLTADFLSKHSYRLGL